MNEESLSGPLSDPATFVKRCLDEGYKWVTQQVNDGTFGAQQRATLPAYRSACDGLVVYTVWLTRPFDAAFAREIAIESQAAGIILEGEIPSGRPESVNWAECAFALQDLPLKKAIVTNFAPFVDEDGQPLPDKAKPLIDAGWACITENFISESPNSTPANTDFFATRALGFPFTQPMVEGWRLEDYGDLSHFRNVSHWDAGNVL